MESPLNAGSFLKVKHPRDSVVDVIHVLMLAGNEQAELITGTGSSWMSGIGGTSGMQKTVGGATVGGEPGLSGSDS